jgi:hypothetical protein
VSARGMLRGAGAARVKDGFPSLLTHTVFVHMQKLVCASLSTFVSMYFRLALSSSS